MIATDHRAVPAGLLSALQSYKRRLIERFGDRVQRVALFGSWARGEATERSDVDVLVLITGLTWQEEIEAARLVADVCTETDVWLSPTIYSEKRFRYLLSIESPFARAVDREGLFV